MVGQIVEVFSSIQGEGKYVGCRQIFVRFAGCNLQCKYCDTAESQKPMKKAKIEQTAGKRDFMDVPNPISMAELAGFINKLLEDMPHHSVSFTGGEPLCQKGALNTLLPLINSCIYVETNGTLPAALNEVLPNVDIISMDIKLPSVTGRRLWDEHHEFLQIACKKEVFVKIVITDTTLPEELLQAVKLIAKIDSNILLILQPVTPLNDCGAASPEQMLRYQAKALKFLRDVRVIPQTHKFMGQL